MTRLRRYPFAMTRLTAAVMAVLLLTGVARSAEKSSANAAALESISAEAMAARVNYLASDALEGREAGSRGGRAAGDYLAGQYARLHLRGAGSDGGYFQPFGNNCRNVLALVPGSDPVLKNEYLLVCAITTTSATATSTARARWEKSIPGPTTMPAALPASWNWPTP